MPAEKMVAKAIEKRIVLVAIRFDGRSRELLDWAIAKVAEPGDCVVAVHVCRNSGDALKFKHVLDSYLEVYNGICSLKKVDLKAQISTGISVRRSLVKEAENHAAAAVVVGIGGQARLRGWSSKAGYCARKLPPTTDVFAIHNGKIVFRRCNNYQLSGPCGDPKPSFNILTRDIQSEFGDSEADTEVSSFELLSRDGSVDSKYGTFETKRRSTSLFTGDILDERPGWPLQRRAITAERSSLRARHMSVVQWAMSLPTRSPWSISHVPSNKLSFFAHNDVTNGSEMQPRTNSLTFKWFAYGILKTATSNFCSANLIGEGGCNSVYKAILPYGRQVAVKVRSSSQEAKKDFVREVEIMSILNHKHITPLLGISITDTDLISVYEFSSKGSLEDNLHGKKKGKSGLSWEVRFSVAVKIAEALNYLHNECARPIIHRDVKSSNILLSDGFEPQLSDFGLAIWGPTCSSFVIEEDMVGTFGYLAPEYFMYGKISDKIDVYAFGIVLLEMLTGRKAIDSESPRGQESLLMWAKPMMERGNARGILDETLAGQYNDTQMKRMVLAARLCTTRSARQRPNMTEVLKVLRGDKEVEKRMKFDQENEENQEEVNDDEVYPNSSAELHFNLAIHDIDDDSMSFSSLDQANNLSLEEYLKERWSRNSSFN